VDSLRIYTGALTNGEIAAMQAANVAPTLSPIPNQVTNAGTALTLTNSASDPDLPWQTLTFSLLAAPAGATIGTNTGIFTWRPPVSQANTTNVVQVKVADNGTPVLSATQSFSVKVNPLAAPTLSAMAVGSGGFGFQVGGDFGPDYWIQASTNLLDWSTVFTTNSPAVPFDWVDTEAGVWPARFYRVRLAP
jgi:hypothetical protein